MVRTTVAQRMAATEPVASPLSFPPPHAVLAIAVFHAPLRSAFVLFFGLVCPAGCAAAAQCWNRRLRGAALKGPWVHGPERGGSTQQKRRLRDREEKLGETANMQ